MTDSSLLTQETTLTIAHLRRRWHNQDMAILRHVFPFMAQGTAPSIGEVAGAAGVSQDQAAAALSNGRAELDPLGRISELYGITFAPTRHRVTLGGHVLSTCCALVAHMVPMLTGLTVQIESVDPVAHALVTLTISPDGVSAVEPEDAVGVLVRTVEEQMQSDVGAHFCSHVNHFCSEETAARFVADESRRYLVSIAQLHAAAAELYRVLWE